ncbi:uncharacterized protein BP01DRAFT_378350 [Aspergillus saccharolyticus JOP 1030-1]|uniref:Uncharacterized protein n=1 Tax=Aspergillus saccharolyticus JOP 1030-1 TaxID=1450539 RepID=A0A318ZQ60_9EURO|nr:hypothetical protein BP01DRAFT_378350 [Aspergillus saccharolyticus JOP 1030-1]PYH49739.1 hypothetical protein BP01DRAFT_378350 [Aspergillus saccharolyticus JOP 1030-1]
MLAATLDLMARRFFPGQNAAFGLSVFLFTFMFLPTLVVLLAVILRLTPFAFTGLYTFNPVRHSYHEKHETDDYDYLDPIFRLRFSIMKKRTLAIVATVACAAIE